MKTLDIADLVPGKIELLDKRTVREPMSDSRDAVVAEVKYMQSGKFPKPFNGIDLVS